MVSTSLYRSLIVRHFLLPTALKVPTLPVVAPTPFGFRLKVFTLIGVCTGRTGRTQARPEFVYENSKIYIHINYNAMFVNSSLNIIDTLIHIINICILVLIYENTILIIKPSFLF